MADSTTLNVMSGGDKIDTEDLGSRGKLQRVKVVLGDLDTDGGDLATENPLPIAGNAAAGSTDSGNPVKTGGKYNATAPTLSDRQRGDTQLDANANLKATLATLIAGEDLTNNVLKVEQRFAYMNVTATGTTTVKSGSGFIHNLVINNPCTLASATTETTIVLYDNTAASGTKIGTLYLPKSTNIVTVMPATITVDSSFSTGLTLSITLGTSGSWTPDITLNYR